MYSFKEKTKEQLTIAEDAATARVIDKILNYAINEEIDELIVAEEKGQGEVKFYEAGQNKGHLLLTEKTREKVCSALKEIAGLKGDVRAGIERGEFKKQSLGKKIVFSVAVYNSRAGEKIVIGVKQEKIVPLNIGHLGSERKTLDKVKKVLDKGQGMVLVVGPFNSGKTGTLYSFLEYLNKPELNVMTVESEVGCELPTVNQSRLNHRAGFDHSSALYSVLRQDPDVVMIDEIADKEAANSAFNLAERGYLVLAGIYSRNISSGLDFFQELGVNLRLFNAAVKLVVSQRLLPKNCSHCLKKEKITKTNLEKMKQEFGDKFLLRLKAEKVISDKIKTWEDISFYRGQGCARCNNTGIVGKIGVFEVLEINTETKKLIKEGHLSKVNSEIKKQSGYTLAEDALAKAANGIVSLDEALKINTK